MAITIINRVKISDVNTLSSDIAFTPATSTTDGIKVDFKGKDFKTLFLIQGGAAAGKVVVKQGNGLQGVTDIEFAVGAGKIIAFTLDSGAFKVVNGADKGNVFLLPSATDIKVAVIELP